MKKIWDGRTPNKGDVVEFKLKDKNQVVGFYCYSENGSFVLSEAKMFKGKPFTVKKKNILYATVLIRHGFTPVKRG